MELKTTEPKLEEITFKFFDQTGFNPHGISVNVDPDTGRVRLFVINHRAQADVNKKSSSWTKTAKCYCTFVLSLMS